MHIALALCGILTLGYVFLILLYRKGWNMQPVYKMKEQQEPSTFISVVIPARNEAESIGRCIDAVLAQRYPSHLLELIIVDDHSEDDTARIVQQYKESNVRCISLADYIARGEKVNAYKKKAISVAVEQSKGDLIVTTDADCEAGENWLAMISELYEREHPVMIVAPVIFKVQKRLVEIFQLIDFMSMQGITAAAHALRLGNMSNGANLAFKRSAFMSVGGYEGVQHLASGDDYLLMTKINCQFPGKISYLKSSEAIVSTAPQPDWRGFMKQRVRWASKSGKYNDTRLTSILLLVYLFNLMLVSTLIAGIFDTEWLAAALACMTLKTAVEYYYLLPVSRFFDSKWVMPWFVLLQPLHVLYIVMAGFLGFFGDYEWKGRRVR